MKKLVAATALAAIIMAANAAQAQEERFPRWYIGANAGYSDHQDSDWTTGNDIGYDAGYSFSVALGYRPVSAPGARFDIEGVSQMHEVDTVGSASATGDLSNTALMFNAYYDFGDEYGWNPYLGAGIGASRVELDSTTLGVDDSQHVFAYQFKAGVAYRPDIMYNVDFLMGYRFFGTTDADIAGVDLSNTTHSLELGTRLHF